MQNDNRLFIKINTEFRVLQVLFRTSFQQPTTTSKFVIQQHLVNSLKKWFLEYFSRWDINNIHIIKRITIDWSSFN